MSRSLSDLIRIIQKINDAGASFKSLSESIDTSTAVGRALMHMLGTFAEFEREIIRERTYVGLKRARANGRIGGGRYILTPQQQERVFQEVRNGKTQTEVARDERISKATVCRLVARLQAKADKKLGLV